MVLVVQMVISNNHWFITFILIASKCLVSCVLLQIVLFWLYSSSYYTNGRTATLPDFYSVSLLDHFIFDARETKMYVDEYQPGTELWLGETSSTYGGGTRGLSDAYVAGFM